MSLKNVSAKLSTDGSQPSVLLMQEGQELSRLPVAAADDSHKAFIISTWLRSYRPVARKYGYEDLYNRNEPAIAESRWQDCFVVTDEGGYTVYAWVCAEQGSLYHVYVVPELRNIGVARELIRFAAGEDYMMAREWPRKNCPHRVNRYLLVKKHG